MAAYQFETRHHPAILAGDKDFTLRQTGKKLHARIGELVTFTGGRGKPAFATGRCTFRAMLVFSASGIHRVEKPTFLEGGEKIWRLLTAAEDGARSASPELLDKIAQRDGFASWAEFWAWHAKHGLMATGRAWREVIGFASVEPK